MMSERQYARLGWILCGLLLIVILIAAALRAAHAQMPDYCSAPLAAQNTLSEDVLWRLRCTIQKLQAERVQQADRATQDEVEISRLNALLHSQEAKKKAPETPKRHK